MILSWNRPRPGVLLAGACALAFAWLVLRHLGLNPAVFSDEWYYSKMSRLVPLHEATLPSYLYLWLFGATNACGERFLDCARAGNALLFVAAAPFVYLSARAFAGAGLALLVAALALLAPMNLYNAFFMPEATYWFGFWVLSWIALACTSWRPAYRALLCGVVLGLMSLVKVHALFLLPALCLFLLYEHWLARERAPWLRGGAVALALAAGGALAVKFALGYLFAGPSGLSLFGSLYGASASASSQRPLLALAAPAFINLRGHLEALAVLFGLPLALMAHALADPAAHRATRDAPFGQARLQLYTLLMLAAALGMTVLYTASIAEPGNKEALRLHLRYYNFLLPLLPAVCAAWLASPPTRSRPRLRIGLAALLALLLALALAKLPSYSPSMIDGPDISAVDLRAASGWLLVALQLAALALWAAGRAAGPRLFLFAAAPAALLFTAVVEQRFLGQLVPSSSYYVDAAGEAGRHAIPKAELRDTTVAATGLAELLRMQFHLDDTRVQLLDLPPGAAVDPGVVPPGSKWLLVAGQHPLPRDFMLVASGPGYRLARAVPRPLVGAARLGGALPNGVVETVTGLSAPEGWGRWSDGKRIRIRLATPLPPYATVVLDASAFGPNTHLPFTLRAGADSATFALDGTRRRVALHLKTDGTVRELTIEVPQPVSPLALGQSRDRRALGMGLARLEVLADPPPALSSRQTEP